jgi:hypothetical protein
MNSTFLTPHSEPCTECLSPPPQPNLTPKRALDGKDDSFSAPSNKRSRIDLPMMPTLDGDGNDNASFAGMLPKTRLSRRNADFQPSWQAPHKANDMPELLDLVDNVSEGLHFSRLVACKSISSASFFPRPSHKASNSLIFLSKAA